MSLIRVFVRHPVAPNLAMIVMVLAGLWALTQLTRQLLPTFQLSVINVSVDWSGAAAEDVEEGVTQPLEDELLGIGELRGLTSTSRDGRASLALEFPESTDMSQALNQVKESVAQVRNLPSDAEEPKVTLLSRTDPVARLVITGPSLEQLRPLAIGLERDLRAAGISRIEVAGLPKEEIAILVPSNQLEELGLSLADIAARVRATSLDVPAGTVGDAEVARQLRALGQQRSEAGFASLPLQVDEDGRLLSIADIASIERRALPNQATLFVEGKPAVEFLIRRSEAADAIDVAKQLKSWAERKRETLPPNVELLFYDEDWKLVDERIELMVDNGIVGLLLVVAALYLFLNGRVAFWVAVGIPVSVLAALTALLLLGGSLNMLSLFALVMAMGIIVDDAIVVGEEAVTRFQNGAGPVAAAEGAANRMLAPVTAASLTTIAAFSPLLTVGGPAGSILFAIPLIVICVVIASLLECFLVLPGHLRHSLEAAAGRQTPAWRRRFDVAFDAFRQGRFRNAVSWAVINRGVTISIGIGALVLALGLLLGGRLGFSFFAQPDPPTLFASARFVSGSPEQRVDEFLDEALAALYAAEKQSGESLVKLAVKKVGQDSRGSTAANLGLIAVELTPPDQRDWTNRDLIRAWQRNVARPAGLEGFVVFSGQVGPPGNDIAVELIGDDAAVLKEASLALQQEIQGFPGASGVRDDTAYGKEQLVLSLTPAGQALGLTERSLSEQLRAAFDGELVQIFQEDGNEIEVRVRIADSERQSTATLETLPVVLPNGDTTALSTVARLKYQRGFDALRHSNGRLAVTVTGDLDRSISNPNRVRGVIRRDILPGLTQEYGVDSNFKGDAENQEESLGDVAVAVPLSLILIYIILAWVFGSYLWPLAVLSVIPFGLVGAFFGHWLLGIDVTALSVFGFFGLSGIVINDSIILVTVFKELREKGADILEAATEAGVRRFRAVLLTSVTTVIGIMPLLFETALQAQFLKPMVVTLGFGLIAGTFMVLFLLPCFLVLVENARARLADVESRFPRILSADGAMELLRAGFSQVQRGEDLLNRQRDGRSGA